MSGLGGVTVISVWVFARVKGVPPSLLSEDPAAVAHLPLYVGVLSYLGILLWTAAAVVCLFTAALVRSAGRPTVHRFFLFSGLIGALLTLDDLFQFHEGLVPQVLGLPQWVYPLAYGTIMVAYLRAFGALILRSDGLLFLLALFFFVGSVSMDILYHGLAFVEDSLKFMGIVFWATYFIGAAYAALLPTASPGETSESGSRRHRYFESHPG